MIRPQDITGPVPAGGRDNTLDELQALQPHD
jgi:hypothetical protein